MKMPVGKQMTSEEAMYAVISPAKKLDFESQPPLKKSTEPLYQDRAFELIKVLRKCSESEISKLMGLSEQLTQLNKKRYQEFESNVKNNQTKQALFCFAGDTYKGLEASQLSSKEVDYAQKHLGILSGLYGLIRPLDLIQPYRLEMGTKLKCGETKNLYDFWSETVTQSLNKTLKKEKYLINLASQEYFGVINTKNLAGEVITPVFKENKNGEFKTIGIHAKKARGMMARFMIENKIEKVEELKKFDREGYRFNPDLTEGNELVFTR